MDYMYGSRHTSTLNDMAYIYEYTGKPDELILSNEGNPVATGFNRIVHGGRGAYVEFSTDQIIQITLEMHGSVYWRVGSKTAYYIEYRTMQDSIKIYYQKRTVSYADYLIGKWYISPVYLRHFGRTGRQYH